MEDTHSSTKRINRFSDFRYKLVLKGVCVGAAAGLVAVLFRLVLEQVEHLLPQTISYIAAHPWLVPVWAAVLLCAAGLVTLLLKWEPMISGSGIPQLDGEILGFFQQSWWRVLLAKFAGGVLTIGAGLSLGREGPSVQLGAMAGKGFARVTKQNKTEEKLLITCGASAGLAAAFNAPLAGALFALEEVHKSFSIEVLLSSMASSVTADFISHNIFGLKPVFDFSGAIAIPLSHFWVVMLVGLLAGVVGVVYNRCTDLVQGLYDKISSRFVRILIPFVLAGIFAFTFPAVLGGGSHLILEVAGGIPLITLCLLFVIKFFFSIFSFGSGVPGGIFLPLLVLGSLCGGIFHGVAASLGLQLNLEALVILGMAASFAAIVRAPVTGILLITEMTGNFSHLLFLALASLTAYATADLLRGKPIYEQLLRRMLFKFGRMKRSGSGEKVTIEVPVHHGSLICGKKIREVNLPDKCLIVSIERGEEELVPNGETVIHPADLLVAVCGEYDSPAVNYALKKQCTVMK